MTIQELAKKYRGFFERKRREDGTSYLCCKENAPDELRELIQKAHGDMLPDDYRYEFVAMVLLEIAEWDDDIEELVDELEPDNSYYDLMQWFTSHSNRHKYVNEATAEFGHAEDIMDDIANGQLLEIKEVFYSVVESLARICENFTSEEN